PGGSPIGALYIAGRRSRRLAAKQRQALQILAQEAQSYLAHLQTSSDRQRIEEELERIDLQYEHLLTSIPSVLVGTDGQGRVTLWNKAAEDVFALSSADVIGKPLRDCKIRWDWDCIELGIDLCKQQGSALNIGEVRCVSPSGQDRFLAVTINPILSDEGQPLGTLFTATDMTDRKLLEAQLAQSQKLESIGQLAAGIAHEINTPIQYVSDNTRFLEESFTEIARLHEAYEKVIDQARKGGVAAELLSEIATLRDEADIEFLKEEIPKALKQSLDGLDRIGHIVHAMKEFSHPGSKEKAAIDLNHALENAITITKSQWKYAAEIVTHFDTDLPLVPCLPVELNQVFVNVIVNAVHAINAAGADELDKKNVITITTRHDKLAAEVWIADTGTGIPPEVQARIFDPFFTTKELGQGTGQGLSMARSVIMDGHGGSITFETEEGRGTTFIIRLPLCASGTEAELAA
ncbi:MAG TPA: ATP-binding protein, partial [Hyphomicrobiales bacterium]|nr:ATP-binding protein [Hyphomicrobiales bacterium]